MEGVRERMNDTLKGRTALVTGVAHEESLGFAIARLLAERGARLGILDISPRVEGCAATLSAAGHQVQALQADLTDLEATQAAVGSLLDATGRLDILVNNAGIAPADTEQAFVNVAELSLEQWERGLAINLRTQFSCIKAALPSMLQAGYGRIVNMSSVTGPVVTNPGMAPYSAAKGGVLGLTRALAIEVGRHGITVNAVAPGWIKTAAHTPEMDIAASNTPIGRPGEPRELAAMVAFLASDEASYITGQLFVVDGGNTIQEYKGPSEVWY